jgi:hypothetical protein
MDPVHFPQELFVSCEDRLPAVAGLHNAASTLSGLAIMAHPVRSYLVARAALPPDIAARHDALCYFAVQLLLFYLNLHQHAAGYVTPDLESGGCLHSIFLAQFLHNHPLQRNRAPSVSANNGASRQSIYRSWTLPQPVVLAVVWAAALRLLYTCILHPQKQTAVASAMAQPFALYVVATMGFRSYHILKHRNYRRPFRLWIAACLSLAASQALVVIERTIVCPSSTSVAAGDMTVWRSRSFHAVLIHAVIVWLFYSVSECAIELVRESATAVRNDPVMAVPKLKTG